MIVTTAGELPGVDLARRIDLRADLPPFTADETADYVVWRLQTARSAARFADEAIAELFAATGGIPSAIGRVADLALIAANAAESETITADVVRSAAEELRPADDSPLVAMTAPMPSRLSA